MGLYNLLRFTCYCLSVCYDLMISLLLRDSWYSFFLFTDVRPKACYIWPWYDSFHTTVRKPVVIMYISGKPYVMGDYVYLCVSHLGGYILLTQANHPSYISKLFVADGRRAEWQKLQWVNTVCTRILTPEQSVTL